MAINYNLSKVYALSDNDPEFVIQIIELFVTEVPQDLKQMENGIKQKDHKQAYAYAHKIKPTLDLLGMTMAYEEILQLEDWTRAEGKKNEIEATFDSIQDQVDKAIKEIKKDFEL
jgi:HPt (histidine-containing phosphotransfer) domain-containing protein